MPEERLLKQTVYVKLNAGKMTVGRPRTRWLYYIKKFDWNRLGFLSSEMKFVDE